ncbi:Glycerate dehydrogenase [Symbiodinium microadriaticum]|uniref:Glycerate dehydrogenase n=1 Tax=Symbiodinium microadriaticum TaxID=2951 RepID=A0A1Q9DY39_SYMMI|nr:Glycerate dehydrogenase [Symbiodinium microadriaticum]
MGVTLVTGEAGAPSRLAMATGGYAASGEKAKVVLINAGRLDFDKALDLSKIAAVAEIPVPGEIISKFPASVRLIQEAGTGFNNVDLTAAKAKGVTVCNCPAYSSDAVAHLVFTLILTLCSTCMSIFEELLLLPGAADAKGNRDNFNKCLQVPHFELQGKPLGSIREFVNHVDRTLGLIGGSGGIGSKVSDLAEALGMKVRGADEPQSTAERAAAGGDFVSLHCPLNAETKHIINKETDLIEALQNKVIAGAGLDVQETEPPAADNPLYELENVILTPHIGWKRLETRQRLMDIVADNIASFLQGKPAAVAYLKNTLLEILECHDKDNDRQIHRDEFELLMRNPEMHFVLTRFGVNVSDLINLKDVLFEDTTEQDDDDDYEDESPSPNPSRTPRCRRLRKLSFQEFLEVVLRLRGGNSASVMDIVDLREYVRQRFDRMDLRMHQCTFGGSPIPFSKLRTMKSMPTRGALSRHVHVEVPPEQSKEDPQAPRELPRLLDKEPGSPSKPSEKTVSIDEVKSPKAEEKDSPSKLPKGPGGFRAFKRTTGVSHQDPFMAKLEEISDMQQQLSRRLYVRSFMPRSQPPSTDSDEFSSDDLFASSDDAADDHSNHSMRSNGEPDAADAADAAAAIHAAPLQGPAVPRGDHLTPGQSARIEWFRKQVLFRLCCAYLELHYKASGYSERSAIQRISSFRRSASGLDRSELEQLVRPRLAEPAATNALYDMAVLAEMLDGPLLPNDMGWVMAIGVPYSGVPGPPKAMLVQQLQAMLARQLARRLRFADASFFAMELVDICANAFYHELVITIWPMLGEALQYDLQQWFFRYACEARDGIPRPAASSTERPSGSGFGSGGGEPAHSSSG